MCNARETAIKRTCEDQLAAQVTASGAMPVTGPGSDNPTGAAPITNEMLAAARSGGAKAILSSTIAPEATVVNPGPTVGLGVGGFGGSGGWNSGGSVGIAVPVGAGQVNTSYAANMVLTDSALRCGQAK